jgi:hypothetical protein
VGQVLRALALQFDEVVHEIHPVLCDFAKQLKLAELLVHPQ